MDGLSKVDRKSEVDGKLGVDWHSEAGVLGSGEFCTDTLPSIFIDLVPKLECCILMGNETGFASLLTAFRFFSTLQ